LKNKQGIGHYPLNFSLIEEKNRECQAIDRLKKKWFIGLLEILNKLFWTRDDSNKKASAS